ncbi:hypothetical protein A8B78_09480 [Jannaschia sp. EhC01]|nr:hypothetical protein A8B78_09480 [Jannaschia sp. EhC01]
MPAGRILFALCLGLCLLWSAAVHAQTRHAFVVGIDTYENVGSLEKARNDARAVAGALEEVGFRTQLLIDADETALLTELTRFSGQLDPGDEVVFYFAGHGVEINGRNYLLPADVPSVAPGQELVVTRGALPVSDVIDQFNARGVRLSLLILDACRDNPFETLGTRSLGRSVGLGREEAPEGTFVMFSAGAGQQALDRLSADDPNPNSVFTRVLLPRLTQPGLPLRTMVREVRSEVRALGRTVAHEQFPAVYDQLDGAFTFVPSAAEPALPPADVALPDAPTGLADPCAAARADWSLIGETPGVALLEAYRTAHSGCPLMMMLASERLAALTATPAPSPPAATLESTPTPAPTPSPQGDVSVPVQVCVAAADPDHISIADLRADAAQATARARCSAALAQITDRASAEGTHVLALLGRAAHAAGDFEEAVSFYEQAAHANPMAASNLGSLYQTGRGVAADGARAAELFQSAGELGAAYGWHNYASLYYRGEVVPLDYDRAAEAYLRAAQQGWPSSMYWTGRMYRDGSGFAQSDAQAAQWFERGAEAGNVNAMTQFGFMLSEGLGVAQDQSAAARWFQAASDAGSAEAAARLGIAYRLGEGVARNPDQAYLLLLRAAEEGNGRAMRHLGQMFAEGDGVAQSDADAAQWYQQGVDAGDAASATHLGAFYFNGRGVTADRNRASELFRQAAEGGDAAGMRNTGVMYREGYGVAVSHAEAMHWFQRAVALGDAFAHYYIGWQYQYGNGVPVNAREAAQWFVSGLAAGHDYAIRNPAEFNGTVGREMQELLRERGRYDGAIDGVIGPGTVAAMRAYMELGERLIEL